MRNEIEPVIHRFFVAGLASQLAAILAAAAISIGIWGSLESTKRTTLINEAVEGQKSQIAEYVFVSDVLQSSLPRRIAPLERIRNTLKQQGIRGRLDLVPCDLGKASGSIFAMSIGGRNLSHCIRFTPDGLGLTWAFGLIVGFSGLCLIIAFGSWRALKARVMDRVLHPLLKKVEDGFRHRILGEMASQVTHDMRSPLAALRAASASLPADDPNRELILLAVGRLNGITSQLLGTRKCLEAMVSDLHPIMASLVEEKRLESGHPIALQLDTHSPCPVLADRDELARALSNLINNAIEASPADSPIELELRQMGPYVEVAVRDHGCGFSDQILAGLRRGVHQTTKPNGSGLGLKGALQFARNVGGEIHLRNRPRRGAETILRIPAAQ